MNNQNINLQLLFEFIAELHAKRGTDFSMIVSAGQLTDVLELDRMFALASEEH